jgi:predicted nucleic acid-binding protein
VELADTSAWVKSRSNATVRAAFDELVTEGEIASCRQVDLELLFTAKDADDFARRRLQLDALPHCRMTDEVWARATDVFELLAQQGPLHHRQVKPADLVIAAAAELAGVGVVHYDNDYDVIAAVTGQPTRWLAPRGTLP